jgi:predicted amidophosphoribosyltransferase
VATIADLDPRPPGFGRCLRCAYRDVDRTINGQPVCYVCASQSIEPLAPEHCRVCGQAADDGVCGNPLCNWGDRFFERVYPISMRTGPLRGAINQYKFHGMKWWAGVFGRVLVGYLNANVDTFEDFDLIVPSPTYTGDGGRPFDHTQTILEAAEVEDPFWPFEYGVIVKTAPTEPFTGKRWKQRKEIAEGPLRSALYVPAPQRVQGKRVLVFDDVFTEGFTIREVARALRDAGAAEVSEVVLARQPYGG